MAKNDLKLFAGGSSANVMTQAEYEALASLVNGFSTGVAQSKQLNKVWRQASFVAAMIGLFTSKKSGEDVLDDADVDGFEEKFASALQAFISSQTAQGAFWQPVISLTITAPPENPVLGDAYVIPADATGAWAGKAQSIAVWTGSEWRIFSAPNGHGVSLADGRVFERVAGTYIEKIAQDAQSGKWIYATADGTANAVTAMLTPAISSYKGGLQVRLMIKATNTGQATLDAGVGSKPIVRPDGSALLSGDLIAGTIMDFVFNEAINSWQMMTAPKATGGIVTYSVVGTHTFIVPSGIHNIKRVRVWGAGGGGGGGEPPLFTSSVGGGGGSGAYGEKINIPVEPGASIVVTVGSGGTEGSDNTPTAGGSGGTSSFGTFLAVKGGMGGDHSVYRAQGGTSKGGAGGEPPTGADLSVGGNTGQNGMAAQAPYFPGAGSGAPFGGGATTLTGGSLGTFPGGGGSGGGGSTAGSLTVGGAGAPGYVTVEF